MLKGDSATGLPAFEALLSLWMHIEGAASGKVIQWLNRLLEVLTIQPRILQSRSSTFWSVSTFENFVSFIEDNARSPPGGTMLAARLSTRQRCKPSDLVRIQ